MIRHKKTTKIWLRVVALMLALLMLGSSTVFAADLDDVPYYSYTYWEGPSRYVAVPMRTMYEATHQIDTDSLGLFEKRLNEEFGFDSEEKLSLSLSHATLSPDMKELYMLDSGNSRIFVVDTDTMELKRVIRTIPLIGEDKENATLTFKPSFAQGLGNTQRTRGYALANDQIGRAHV